MDPKAEGISKELSQSLDNCHVEYQFSNGLHKFRVEWGPTHWLYVARAFVDDHTIEELLTHVNHWEIPRAFRTSQQQRWLFLSESEVREVNDTFGRGHAL